LWEKTNKGELDDDAFDKIFYERVTDFNRTINPNVGKEVLSNHAGKYFSNEEIQNDKQLQTQVDSINSRVSKCQEFGN